MKLATRTGTQWELLGLIGKQWDAVGRSGKITFPAIVSLQAETDKPDLP